MNDLDWLARNVHEWPDNHLGRPSTFAICYFHKYKDGEDEYTCDWAEKYGLYTKSQWLARRAELQNKPSWGDAPEWAEWLAQDESGHFYFYADKPSRGARGWIIEGAGQNENAGVGEVLGSWRDTLENRPADLSEQAVTARLQEATGNVLAAAHGLKNDKYKFEPFVSAADAATSKQPAPKGIGSPILGMVLADLTNRALEGKDKYGEPLLAHNGRNPLWDAYQEALDLAMYLRQAIEEQK